MCSWKGTVIIMKSICGIDCDKCEWKPTCNGCTETEGKPFGGTCMLAACVKNGNRICDMKAKLIAEFNALGIEDMQEITDLYALKGGFVNLEYTLPGGQKIKFWDENRLYLGNQLCKKNSERCYGITADENYLLVCEYGENGSDPEIIVYKKRR